MTRLRAFGDSGGQVFPRSRAICAALAALLLIASSAGAQMPDARQMSGIPRPDPQLATGTVTVRVARGSFANPVDSLDWPDYISELSRYQS